ncbi:MAG: acetate kinase [Actinomycetota bacterium]
MKIMTLNCGSSSVKYSVWEMPGSRPLCQGIVDRVTIGSSSIWHRVAGAGEVRMEHDCPTHDVAIRLIFDTLTDEGHGVVRDLSEIDSVAHRVVHGGDRYTHSVLIDDEVIRAIEDFAVLAPLHNPKNLIGIRYAVEEMREIPHTASWDTAFSAAFMPLHTSVYAIPYEYYSDYGVRRYGYQGLSHLYVTKRAAALMAKRSSEVNLVSLHIGNGSTATAVKNGVAFDQSLGFSTCGEGLVMGTRCGDLDPIVPLFLMQHAGLTLEQAAEMLYRRSGIFGLSGHVDRRDLIEAASRGDERSQLALEVECYRLKKYIGAYAAAVGGVDAVVFTAGVGESSALHREKSCEGLGFLGIRLDEERNATAVGRGGETEISTPDSEVKVFVIPTDEELVMVEDAHAIFEGRFKVHTEFEYSFEKPDFVPSYLRFE